MNGKNIFLALIIIVGCNAMIKDDFELSKEEWIKKYIDALNRAPCMLESKCQVDKRSSSSLFCQGFTNFSEIRLDCDEALSNPLAEFIQTLRLLPHARLRLDSSFKISQIKFPIITLEFYDVDGIEMENSSLSSMPDKYYLILRNSHIDFYMSGKLLNESDCSRQVFGQKAFFQNAIGFELENTASQLPLCSLAFQNLDLESFQLNSMINNMFSHNYLPVRFWPIPFDIQLNLTELSIVKSKLSFTSSLINKDLFGSVAQITLENCQLNDASNEVFEGLNYLRVLKMIDMNFADLMLSRKLPAMLASINVDLNMNSSVLFSLDTFQRKHFAVMLHKNNFEISEIDFCTYKDFPVDRYIIPIFYDPPAGKCNCAFYFLNMFSPFNSYSLFRIYCITKTRKFYNELLSCNFDRRIEECYKKENKTFSVDLRFKYKNIIYGLLDLVDEETTTTEMVTTKTTTTRKGRGA